MLGIITILGYTANISYIFGGLRNYLVLIPLIIMGFIITLIINGYGFKIIKTSLNGLNELPKFDAWLDMLKNGTKILVVGIVYLIPIMIFSIIFYEVFFIYTVGGIIMGTPLGILSSILEDILTLFLHGKLLHVLTVKGFPLFTVLVYYIVIIPIYYVAIANMANNNGKLSTAFQLSEILNKTKNIGFKKISIFYLLLIPIILIYKWELLNVVYLVFIGLIISPYLKIFISRFIGLIYIDDSKTLEKVK